MKRYLLLLLPLIASCELYTTPDYPFEEGYDLRYDVPSLTEYSSWPCPTQAVTIDQSRPNAYLWALESFRYIEDLENEWKTPIEFYKDGGGDCEDYVIFYAYLLYIYLGIEGEMIIQYRHATYYFEYRGVPYLANPTGSKLTNWPVEGSISDEAQRFPYHEMMYKAHYLN